MGWKKGFSHHRTSLENKKGILKSKSVALCLLMLQVRVPCRQFNNWKDQIPYFSLHDHPCLIGIYLSNFSKSKNLWVLVLAFPFCMNSSLLEIYMAGTLFFKERKLFFCSLKNTLLVEMFFIFGIIINTFAFAGLDRGCCVVDPHEGHLYPGEECRHFNCEPADIYSSGTSIMLWHSQDIARSLKKARKSCKLLISNVNV